MSPDEYTTLKAIYLARVQECFPTAKVACLTEAPEKEDYGDMDIFVAVSQKVEFIDLADSVGAAGVISQSSGEHQSCSLAVPRDGSRSGNRPVVYKPYNGNSNKLAPSATVTTEEYAQVDIDIVHPDILPWHAFYYSYGDLAGLIGHTVKHLGFLASDRGLWLRLKELDNAKSLQIQNVADKDGRIFLSDDPVQVMRFLGLSPVTYNAGFTTIEELYKWVATSRFLFAESVKTDWDNSRDRHRLDKRKLYSGFFKEWLPERFKDKPTLDEEVRRQRVNELREKFKDEAVALFGKQEEFVAKRDAIVRKVQHALATSCLKPLIAQHSKQSDTRKLAEIVRAFRRHVVFSPSGQPYASETPHTDAESQLYRFLADDGNTLEDPQGTGAWVEEHWEELKLLQKQVDGHGSGHGQVEA